MDQFNEIVNKHGPAIVLFEVVVVIILVIVLIWNSRQVTHVFQSNLAGMWIASNEFCERSGIDGMMVYIGPDIGGYHKAYLIMYSNNTVVLSRAIEIRFGMSMPKLFMNPVITKTITLSCQDPDESLDEIMPEKQTLTMDLTCGRMEWTAWDDEQEDYRQYAEFYRDNVSSTT